MSCVMRMELNMNKYVLYDSKAEMLVVVPVVTFHSYPCQVLSVRMCFIDTYPLRKIDAFIQCGK